MSTAYFTHPDCRAHDMGAGHPECPARLDAIADQMLASGPAPYLDHHDAPLALPEQLARAHTAGYVAEMQDLLAVLVLALSLIHISQGIVR